MTKGANERKISFGKAIFPGVPTFHFARSALGFAKETRDEALDLEVGSWIFVGLSVLLEGVLAAGSMTMAKENPELGILVYGMGRVALARGAVFLGN